MNLKKHPKVKEISTEEGGDFIMVYLKPGYTRYFGEEARCKGFHVDDYNDDYFSCKSDTYDHEAHLKAAKEWLDNDVYEYKET